MTFNLRDIAREAIKSANVLDWSVIADDAMELISPEDQALALRQALPVFLRAVASDSRTPEPVRVVTQATPSTTSTPSPRSWKVQAIRLEWQRKLDTIYAVDGGGRKRLGDFTLADVQFQSNLNLENARKARHRAQHWDQLAEELLSSGAATVRELEESRVASIIGEVA